MIKSVSVLFYYLLFIVTFCNNYVLAQNEPIRIGSYILSSDDPQYTLYNNYQQMLDLGLNFFSKSCSRTTGTTKKFQQLISISLCVCCKRYYSPICTFYRRYSLDKLFYTRQVLQMGSGRRCKFSSKWCCWHEASVRSSCGFRMVK